MKVLVTGAAGFIGFHLVSSLLSRSIYEVVGLDIINDYYDVNLKYKRLDELGIDARLMLVGERQVSSKFQSFHFLKADLGDFEFLVDLMLKESFDYVVNLAAQAGVRYSLKNPRAYLKANVDGFLSILEGCRHSGVKHLLYASTSSVYGLNSNLPFVESSPTEHPISLYAATKKANELMAHTYSHLFNLPTTGLRFFTVYGPWGRPDMALHLFADAIVKNRSIDVYNQGNMIRDFTYVADIVWAIENLVNKPAKGSDLWDSDFPRTDISSAPYQIFNIGNNRPVRLMEYIEALERSLQTTAEKNFIELQPGDVLETHADISKLEEYINFKPSTNIQDGIDKFVEWFLAYSHSDTTKR
jgi:UDP-glucuronate 4-epimerase